MRSTAPQATKLLALALPLFLIGCGFSDSRPQVVKPPVERLTCAAEPAPPAGNSDREAAGFLVEVIDAGRDCRKAVGWLRDWFKDMGE